MLEASWDVAMSLEVASFRQHTIADILLCRLVSLMSQHVVPSQLKTFSTPRTADARGSHGT